MCGTPEPLFAAPNAVELNPDVLLELGVDLLIPAAVEGVLLSGNAPRVQARTIVEGANGPTTREADQLLAQRGVTVVPDILVTSGGVVVSYFEWVQANQTYWWTEDAVNQRLRQQLVPAWEHVLSVPVARTRPCAMPRCASRSSASPTPTACAVSTPDGTYTPHQPAGGALRGVRHHDSHPRRHVSRNDLRTRNQTVFVSPGLRSALEGSATIYFQRLAKWDLAAERYREITG